MSESEQIAFKTDVQELLNLVTHSLYSHKEIFLRELISNASDAIDKIRFEALRNPEVLEDKNPEWKIEIIPNKDAKTITIIDNGCGMSQAELIENIGTIAHSGTKAFLEKVKGASSDQRGDFIGQFGVGFYSAFIVADKVVIKSRKAGDRGVQWTSDGKGTYTIEATSMFQRGTEIILHLKDDAQEFVEDYKLREIIKKYSDFIAHPIYLHVFQEKENKYQPEKINSQTALWLKSASEIKPEEYQDFYKSIGRDYENPLKTIHFAAEGTLEFKALLFLPTRAPFDLYAAEMKMGLQLYVNRVFITDECKKLLPPYLRFVKGVVDCADIPLNVSREMVQEDPLLDKIRKNVVRKLLNTMADLMEKEPELYQKFYQEFGKVLKEGLHFDFENKDKLTELLLFETSQTAPGTCKSLKDYVAGMKEKQKDIYYLLGEDRDKLLLSPQLEFFKKNDIEVILLADPVDHWMIGALTEYDKKQIKSIATDDLDLQNLVEEKQEENIKNKAQEHKDLLQYITEQLQAYVKEVRFSQRLTDSFCCLVTEKGGMNAQMEQMFRAMGQMMPPQKKILELNAEHPLLTILEKLYTKESKLQLNNYLDVIYQQALLADGAKLSNPQAFIKNLSELMIQAAH